MNTYYRDNLKAVMQVGKKYTNDKIEEALELLEDYELSSETISQTSQTATALSNVRTSSLIEVGGNCVKYTPSETSNTNVAYEKSIPNNTYKLYVNKLGGMSYKSENLINIADVSETTKNDVTYSVTDGVITLNGTASASFTITFNFTNTLPSGTYYSNFFTDENNLNFDVYYNGTSINVSDVSQQSLTFSTNVTNMLIFIASGKSYTNYVVKPMLVSGSTAPTEYSEYFSGIRHTAVTSVTNKGANLVNLTTTSATTTSNVTYSASGSEVTLNGTSSSTVYITIMLTNSLSEGDYVCGVFTENPNSLNAYYQTSGSDYSTQLVVTSSVTSKFKTATSKSVDRIFITISSGITFTNCVLKFIAVSGSTTPTSYLPYRADIVTSIPDEIQALDGYGWGISESVNNYADFDNGTFVKMVGRVALKDLSWAYHMAYGASASYKVFYVNISDSRYYGESETANVIVSEYTPTTRNDMYNNGTNKAVAFTGGTYLSIIDNTYTSLADFIAHFSDTDYLYYELASTVTTDISSYLDDDFNVLSDLEGNGTLVFDNTYKQSVPSEISFVGTIKETLVTSFTIGSETTSITDSIESDGWSVSNSIYNYRNIRDKERYTVVGRVDLGTLTWSYHDGTLLFFQCSDLSSLVKIVANSTIANMVCAIYTNATANDTYNNVTDKTISITSTGLIQIYDTSYTDADTFKTAMSGVYLYYELATPEVTSLDVDTDFHYIGLESEETITFNNENNQACHNTIRYSIMEEKA